ncbi:MAG TPA: STAS domain-containing protein [Humisphaera sp.]|jgi:anti-anti-sigma factor|nr:STAS domain-containing protein [Humisphaera sp.]
MQPLQVEIEKRGTALIVRLLGEMSLQMEDVDVAFRQVAAQRPALVVVDLEKLQYISSLGIGLLLALRKDMGPGGIMRIAGAQGMAIDALRRARLMDLFEFCENVDDAIAGKKTAATSK